MYIVYDNICMNSNISHSNKDIKKTVDISNFDKKYMMISTEFKNINQQLGLLNNYVVNVSNILTEVEIELFKIINGITKEEIYELLKESESSLLTSKNKKDKFNNLYKTIIKNIITNNINSF